jgi:hypothetical protein
MAGTYTQIFIQYIFAVQDRELYQRKEISTDKIFLAGWLWCRFEIEYNEKYLFNWINL